MQAWSSLSLHRPTSGCVSVCLCVGTYTYMYVPCVWGMLKHEELFVIACQMTSFPLAVMARIYVLVRMMSFASRDITEIVHGT